MNLEFIKSLPMFLGLAIVCIVVVLLVSQFDTELNSREDLPSQGKDMISDSADTLPWVFDWLILAVYLAICIVTVGSAYYMQVSPWLGLVSFFFFILLLGIPLSFSNAWTSFTDNSSVRATAQKLPVTNFLMEYYAQISVGVGVLSLIASRAG